MLAGRLLDDEYNDPEYTSIDIGLCQQLVGMYTTDPDIQTFSTAMMNHALAGGITFMRKDRAMKQEDADWHNITWGRWLREVEKMLFCTGFCIASSVQHPVYGHEPTVLNLEFVDIKYKLTVHGVPDFRVFEVIDANNMLTSSVGTISPVAFRRRLHDIKFWVTTPPGKEGSIRSPLRTLVTDMQYEHHLLRTSYYADLLRANPPLVSQSTEQKYDVTKAITGSAMSQDPRGGTRLGRGDGPANNATHQAGQIVALLNQYSDGDINSLQRRVNSMTSARVNNSMYEQVWLAEGRQLVNQHLPEAPHDILLTFRQSRMVRVALLFGLTLPALTRSPTEVSQVKKGGTNGAENDGSSSVYFENFQRELKQRLLIYVHQHYNFINAPSFALEILKQANKQKVKVSSAQLREEVRVTVALPGQPEDETLHRLYTEGILKYEAYIHYMGCKHNIPEGMFEKTPKLDLKDLRGIQDPPPQQGAAGGPPAKKAKKA